MLHTTLIAALLSAFCPSARAAPEPIEVPRAAALQVTTAGFDTLAGAIAGLAPESITEEQVEGEFECLPSDAAPLAFVVEDLTLYVEVLDSQLVPVRDGLDLSLALSVWGDSPAVTATGECLGNGINETCTLDISSDDPILAEVSLHIDMLFREDTRAWVVNVDDPVIALAPIPNPIGDGARCNLDDLLNVLIAIDESFLNNLVWSLLADQLTGLGEQVEEPIVEALDALNLETSFALGGASIDIALAPSEFRLRDTGLFLGLSASAAPSALAPCVADAAPPALSGAPWPDLGATSWNAAMQHDAALVLGKDLTDALLWSVWGTGTFCLEVSDLAGASLGTDLLSQLLGEGFAELFPEDRPAALVVEAGDAPTARFDEEMPLYIDLAALHLDAVAELDDRKDRVCRVTAEGAIGVDLNLSGSTFAPALDIAPDALRFAETYSELLPPGYAEGIADFLPTVLGSLLPSDLLPAFDLPSFQGIGVGEVDWVPSEGGEWLGGFVLIDAEDVQPLQVQGCAGALGCGGDGGGGGCDEALGCDGGACDTGSCEDGSCAHGGRPLRLPGGRIALGVVMLAMAALRRRA